MSWIDEIPWLFIVVACAFFGLAPFTPEPHVWEKLKMLAAGELVRPIDIFDLLLHASPFLLAGVKFWRDRQLASGKAPRSFDP